MVIFSVLLLATAQAQYTVIYNFGGGVPPYGNLAIDPAGNLYGTTLQGGTYNYGMVFKLTQKNSSWVMTPLYEFGAGGHSDGGGPLAGVLRDPSGVLYGTTGGGGPSDGGTVYELFPSATIPQSVLTPWTEEQLYFFWFEGPDGRPYDPSSELTFDSEGNLYGTTVSGGTYDCGTVYKLTRSGGQWNFSVVYNFDPTHGCLPGADGVTLDAAGNLYGTAMHAGAFGYGTIWQITPSGTANVLHNFSDGDDGGLPRAGLTPDSAGNMFGATIAGGVLGGGVLYELSQSNGEWVFTRIYDFLGNGGPYSRPIFDRAGDLYGTTFADGAYEMGSVFKLTPSNGSWTYTDLHDFTCCSNGQNPAGGMVFDTAGNLYGTASGYEGQDGIAFEIPAN